MTCRLALHFLSLVVTLSVASGGCVPGPESLAADHAWSAQVAGKIALLERVAISHPCEHPVGRWSTARRHCVATTFGYDEGLRAHLSVSRSHSSSERIHTKRFSGNDEAVLGWRWRSRRASVFGYDVRDHIVRARRAGIVQGTYTYDAQGSRALEGSDRRDVASETRGPSGSALDEPTNNFHYDDPEELRRDPRRERPRLRPARPRRHPYRLERWCLHSEVRDRPLGKYRPLTRLKSEP